jgi:hypothetical protein
MHYWLFYGFQFTKFYQVRSSAGLKWSKIWTNHWSGGTWAPGGKCGDPNPWWCRDRLWGEEVDAKSTAAKRRPIKRNFILNFLLKNVLSKFKSFFKLKIRSISLWNFELWCDQFLAFLFSFSCFLFSPRQQMLHIFEN